MLVHIISIYSTCPGAAWWQVKPGVRTSAPALLVGKKDCAAQLVASAQHCAISTLRIVAKPEPSSKELTDVLLDFLIGKLHLYHNTQFLKKKVAWAITHRADPKKANSCASECPKLFMYGLASWGVVICLILELLKDDVFHEILITNNG